MASVSEICNQANEEYVNENYHQAVKLYTNAIEQDESRDDIYYRRAQALIQLGNLKDAVDDCDKALKLNANNNKACLKKGTSLFQLDDIEAALNVFVDGKKRFDTDTAFDDWIKKCQAKLEDRPKEPSLPSTETPEVPVIPSKPKMKYDWYQTHTHVTITVLMKGVKKENLIVDVQERSFKLEVHHEGEEPLSLNLCLSHNVDPDQSATRLFPSKIEVKLKKGEGIQWSKLEGAQEEEEKEILPAATAPESADAPKYPSSSHYTRDWDKLAAEVTEEEKNEKLEGDAALNQFFQKIYSDASDDTKKAMMKSFTESGGTVLSTNWNEVGTKKVDVKPPDGMEYKKWES